MNTQQGCLPDMEATVYETHFFAFAPKYFNTAPLTYKHRNHTGDENAGRRQKHYMLTGIPLGEVKSGMYGCQQSFAVDRHEERCRNMTIVHTRNMTSCLVFITVCLVFRLYPQELFPLLLRLERVP